MKAYYNEFDKNAAAWLRELITDGLIAPGDVDERSIIDVDYKDLEGYTQHHFFAGIGGWSYALRIAGWPDEYPVWTASLPCQPFSAAGKQLGKQDERHLLPHFLELVKKCKPDTIFGEQVERAIGHGWLDDLQATMEAENYAVGHCVLGAHSVGMAHIRQRLYWVADSQSERVGRASGISNSETGTFADSRGYENGESVQPFSGSSVDGMGISNSPGSQQRIEAAAPARHWGSVESAGGIDWVYCRDNKYRPIESGLKPLVDGVPRGMVHSSDPRNTQEARSMRLKGYGNAIVPQVAAEFISAFMDTDPLRIRGGNRLASISEAVAGFVVMLMADSA